MTPAVASALTAALAALDYAGGWANESHVLAHADPLVASDVRDAIGRVSLWATEKGHLDPRGDAAIVALGALLDALLNPERQTDDAAQARADRLRRADDIEVLAERIACSPVVEIIIAGAEVNGIHVAAALFNFAAKVIDEGAKRRREAEQEPPATCVPGCVRLASEGPGHPGACSTPGRQP